MPATIITALYDLYNSQEKLDHYLTLGKLWSEIEAPMVIFTEESLVEPIMKLREEYLDITTIVIQKMPYWSYKEQIEKALEQSPIPNRSETKDTTEYFIYHISKFDWIRQAASMNPHRSNHFAWFDFGLSKFDCINPESINAIVHQPMPDRIRMMMISCPPKKWLKEPSKAKECFNEIRHHYAGGVITGSIEYLLRLSIWADQYHHKMLSEGWYQLDEVVLAMAHQQHPTAFDVYYGTYQTISSYHHPGPHWSAIMSIGEQLLASEWYDQLDHWRKYIQYEVPASRLYQLVEITILYYFYYADARGLAKRLPRFINDCLQSPSLKQLKERQRENLKYYEFDD